MERAEAISYALAKPGAWSDSPWGEDHDVVKVGSKIFLFPGASDGRFSITVKNTAEAVDELRQRYPEFAGPAAYLDKRLWVRLVIDEVPAQEVIELIDDSYDLVVSKLKKAERP
jgi:predicted DNA-binding protein (MmcQ/YjbR family)